jgi:membrane protein YqaA with SNARE-associated domain
VIRKLYDWMLRQAGSRSAPYILAAVAFAESSFFPIPPDVMLAPMVVSRREKAYQYALICTVASVIGGCFGYAIGYFLEPAGQWLLSLTGHKEGLHEFQKIYAQWGLWVILIKGFTPFPYKLVTIASGLAAFNFWIFLGASIVTRGGRFFLTAFLLKRFGPQIQEVVEKRLNLFALLVVALFVGGLLLVKLL